MGLGIGIAISPILSNTIGSGNPPINTVTPIISGDISLGGELSTTNGTWVGDPVIAYSYQWNRNGTAILGATNSTYTITISDSNKNITCTITATNDTGSANATSNTISIPVFSAPSNTVAPAITGTAQEGQTVTCSTGTWTGTPTITYAYQWKRNGSNIGSATNSTYTLVTADVSQSITCEVTASNAVGSTNATSNTIIPISAFTGLLDTYSGATVAYSFRRLSSTYNGNCIRVRRSSDNTEQNIGFSNNILDTTSLLSFVGSGNGFITTWYDQSGNANNSTQTTATSQPRIVSSGVLETINSKPAISFDGTDDFMNLNSLITVGASSYNSFVGKRDASARSLYGLSGTDRYLYTLFNDNKYYLQAKTNQSLSSNATDASISQLLLTGLNNAGTMAMYKNGSVIASTASSNSILNTIDFIGKYWYGLNAHCKLQEIVFYNSEKSSSRIGIESNINTYYTIY